jgi:diacylglycerol kinase family enzyme
MRVALIVNRASGSGTDADAVAAALRDGGAEVQVFDRDELDAARGAQPERLVVAGGDGSISSDTFSIAGLPS